MQDVKARTWYFQFNPGPEAPNGLCGTPFMGEVEPGRVYEVTNPTIAGLLHDHPEWEAVERQSFQAQGRADQADTKESADEEQ